MGSAGGDEHERLLDEQVSYYRAIAADYLDQGPDLPGGGEVIEALKAFRPTGSVLELACGPGVWIGASSGASSHRPRPTQASPVRGLTPGSRAQR
jgi:hypothetical protein